MPSRQRMSVPLACQGSLERYEGLFVVGYLCTCVYEGIYLSEYASPPCPVTNLPWHVPDNSSLSTIAQRT